LIERLCERLALAGGVALLGALVVLVVTVAGSAFGKPLLGDSELVELLCGMAVFAFLPYCHLRGSNVIVDFFTQPLPKRARHFLDFLMNIVFTAVAAVLAWRLAAGGITAWERSRRSMFLQLPDWWGYAFGVLAMLAWIAVCVWSVRRSYAKAFPK
jgi:TRAP-type C4-dicarboxylate transport system permease small subunit